LEVLGLVEKQPFNISLFSFQNDMLIIFEKLISSNIINFRFTNIEAAKTITSAEIVDENFIVSMESCFQTSLMETYD
jgi:hypothetical protein